MENQEQARMQEEIERRQAQEMIATQAGAPVREQRAYGRQPPLAPKIAPALTGWAGLMGGRATS